VEGDGRYVLETTEEGLTLTAIGIPKHSASPQDSVNAAWLTASLLLKCPSLSDDDRAVLSVMEALLSTYYGEAFGISCEDPNFGKLTCVNGITKTEDGRVRMLFDVRYGTATDPDAMLETVRARVDALGWTLDGVKNNPGYCLSADHPMIPVLLGAYRDCTGETAANYRYSLGGTYARHLPNAFSVGTMVPPKAPLAIQLPAGHGGAHQSDEILRIDDYLEAIAITAQMLLAAAQAL
jgi:succinyl-diaminopimelate desuccinylase